ncbi:MAG TPA: ABC transporter permease subunit, partial [Symbiobacteriaceae bacterium]|nr:ABC transporter permease subunit [Symbiobacteriaceae bacterium]
VFALLLPALVVTEGRLRGNWYIIEGFHTDLRHYWSVVSYHLLHLAKGQLIPSLASLPPRSTLKFIPAELATALPITLKLNGTAFVVSLVLGLLLGALLSALSPRWLRAPLWGVTSLLYSLPDLLIASMLNLAFLLVALLRGGVGPLRGSDSWQHFWAPTVALTLIVLPYIARVTATAIDEISGQQYIRTAVARGLHPVWILLKHIGKNVLVRVSTILPVVVSLLFSGGAVVEYMSEVHGVGRALIINAGPQAGDRYAGVAFLIPMLVVFTIVLALSELVQRLLDPRIAASRGGSEAGPAAGRIRIELPSVEGLIRGAANVGAWLRSVPGALLAGVVALPGRLRKAMRDRMLLAGSLLVLGLVVVAVLAPWIAPFDPALKAQAIQLPGGVILVPPFTPGGQHWLGTDDLGRDVFSQILFGTRYALVFAMLAVPARFLLAVPFGLLAAFRGGTWAKIIRWTSIFFTAVPQVLLPLALIPAVNLIFMDRPGTALFWGVVLVALPGAPRLAGSVQQQAAEVLALPMVEGAYAVGAGTGRTLFRYILPQIFPQLATMLTLEIPAILTTTALLGYFRANPGGAIYDTQTYLPIAPKLPEWGSLMESPMMLLLAGRWWLWAPFIALCVAVLAFNLVGEGMRRALASRTGWKWQG